MKTLKLTNKQYKKLKEFIIESCESIMDRSLDWGDSDYAEEILDTNEILFEFRSTLEEVE